MNRRGVALVVVVVLAIGFGAWWLSALPVEVAPSPPALVVEREEAPPSPKPHPAPPAPPVISPTPALDPVDAGVMADLEIEVSSDGVGAMVELVGESGRVSRPADVMGFARFTIPAGEWRMTAPTIKKLFVLPSDGGVAGRRWYWREGERDPSAPFQVSPPITYVRVDLPSTWTVHGKVIDSRGDPVSGAEVSWPPYDALSKRFTSVDGKFSIETREDSLQLQAKGGASRSMMRRATPSDRYVSLVLEEWTQLKVEGTPKNGSRLFVRVIHGDEIVAVGSDDEPLLVPVGHLKVLARRKISGRVYSGKAQIDVKVGVENELEVELSPTPPITGTVVDESGHPMADLGVHIRQIEFVELPPPQKPTLNALVRRGDAGVPALSATTRTNRLGEFTWMPDIGRSPDPIFQVLVVELWRAKTDPVLVKLDEAPLSIVVEPAPTQ